MSKKIFESKWTFYTVLFIVFFVFFSQIHPLVPFNSDDWINMGMARRAYPSFAYWNPTKVFPECFEPIAAMFAAYCVTPIIGDYLSAQIVTNAAIVSLFIILYLFSTHRLLEYKFNVGKLLGFGLVTLYALFHFLILRTGWSNNEYLWYSHDCNCYYHYTIPNLLCASLVMWLMRHNVQGIKDKLTIGILVFVTYLALCSNLYSTIILTAYLGSTLVIDLFKTNRKEAHWLNSFIRNHSYSLTVIALWFIVQLIEANGRRATSYGHLDRSLIDEVVSTFKYFVHIHYNLKFLALVFFSIITAKAYNYFKVKKNVTHFGRIPVILIFALFLSTAYLILLSSRVSVTYIQRGDVIFSYAFFLLLLTILCISYLCIKIRYFKLTIPFLILFVFYEQNTQGNVYKEIQHEYGLDAQSCLKLDRYIIGRVCEADAQGLDTVIIKVPKFNDDDNWPLSKDLSENLGTTLYKHNVTKRKITTLYEICE